MCLRSPRSVPGDQNHGETNTSDHHCQYPAGSGRHAGCPVVVALKMSPVFNAVSIPFVRQFIDDEETVQANEVMEQAATAMLDELKSMEHVLAPLRAQQLAAV